METDPSRTRQKVLLSCGASEWLTVFRSPFRAVMRLTSQAQTTLARRAWATTIEQATRPTRDSVTHTAG